MEDVLGAGIALSDFDKHFETCQFEKVYSEKCVTIRCPKDCVVYVPGGWYPMMSAAPLSFMYEKRTKTSPEPIFSAIVVTIFQRARREHAGVCAQGAEGRTCEHVRSEGERLSLEVESGGFQRHFRCSGVGEPLQRHLRHSGWDSDAHMGLRTCDGTHAGSVRG